MQNGKTALIRAGYQGRLAIVQYLIEETPAQVNATSNVSYKNSVHVCTVTIEYFVGINFVFYSGYLRSVYTKQI